MSNVIPLRSPFLTTTEAAQILKVSSRTVLNWIKEERVPYMRLPTGEYRLPRRALMEALEDGAVGFDLSSTWDEVAAS